MLFHLNKNKLLFNNKTYAHILSNKNSKKTVEGGGGGGWFSGSKLKTKNCIMMQNFCTQIYNQHIRINSKG
jgi:hypothetical protein